MQLTAGNKVNFGGNYSNFISRYCKVVSTLTKAGNKVELYFPLFYCVSWHNRLALNAGQPAKWPVRTPFWPVWNRCAGQKWLACIIFSPQAYQMYTWSENLIWSQLHILHSTYISLIHLQHKILSIIFLLSVGIL